MRVEIPFPISVNKMYRNTSAKERAAFALRGIKKRGRAWTPEYKAWRQHAGHLVNGQLPVHGPFKALIELDEHCCPDVRGERGADNYIKAPLDLLVGHKLIDNDEACQREVTVRWANVEGAVVEVRPA